jgi:hypothetical protein
MTQLINGAIVVYSLIIAGMGTQAYLMPREGHTPSIISVVASVGIAALMFLSLYIWKSVNQRGGRIMSLIVAAFVVARFLPTFLSEQVWYPAGISVLLSLALIGLLGFGHLQAARAK